MTSTAATTQINVRIDRALKNAGDAALLDAGITPSEAIRALWELAVRTKQTPHALHGVLFPKAPEEANKAAEHRAAQVARALAGQKIVEDALGTSEAADCGLAAPADDKELYFEALLDRRGSRWSL